LPIASIAQIFATEKFDRVIHLAAQAGVRYSLENPHAYADANLIGYLNILEGCRHTRYSTCCMPLPVQCMG
jgi:UDP-glucuronate 4-epimerase